MPVAKLRKGALTIPVEIRKKACLEDGILISVEYNPDDGVIILKPTDGEDSVTLSQKGIKMIEEALNAERRGDVVGPFSNVDAAIKALNES